MKQIIFTQTRPPPSALLEQLADLQVNCCWQPLLDLQADISATFRQGVRYLPGFSGIIVVSRFAASLAMPRIADRWTDLPAGPAWYAVGRSTAQMLQTWGVEAQVGSEETSEGLLALPDLMQPAGQRWWILAGRGGRRLLAETLELRGAQVEAGYLYRRLPGSFDVDLLMQEETRTAICVASAAALSVLTGSLGPEMRAASRLVLPSERLTALARNSYGFKHLLVAEGAQFQPMVKAALKLLEV